jgi:hypothetical protein
MMVTQCLWWNCQKQTSCATCCHEGNKCSFGGAPWNPWVLLFSIFTAMIGLRGREEEPAEKIYKSKPRTDFTTLTSRLYLSCFSLLLVEPEELSRYSDWLRAGRLKGRSSSPSRGKNFDFSKSSRKALKSTQPPIQWVPEAFSPGGKAAGAWSWSLTYS